MRLVYTVAFMLVFVLPLYSQTSSDIEQRIRELTSRRNSLRSDLKQVESEPEELLKLRESINKPEEAAFSEKARIKINNTAFRLEPDFFSKVVFSLSSGEPVQVIGYKNAYWKINYQGSIGFVPEVAIESESFRESRRPD